jgi:putative glycosyltransferase (TIGR04372 family)
VQPPDRPMVIVTFIGTQALGDFLGYNLVAASIAREFPGSKLAVIYRDDRPYKDFITRINPYVTMTCHMSAKADDMIPLDWFDGRTDVPGRPFGKSWYEHGFHKPDIFLNASMSTGDMTTCLWPPPTFRIPRDVIKPLTARLKSRGLDENRWFVCVHMREIAYRWRPRINPLHNVDPQTYLPMITRIIREQGGQVVRMGDPSMTPLPEMDGLIDLSADPDSFPEQAFATSRARFYIGSASGPVGLACAFKVPAAITNCFSVGVWNAGDIILTKSNMTLQGRPLTPKKLAQISETSYQALFIAGLTFEDNSPEDLCAVADQLYETTTECEKWREQATEEEVSPTGSVIFPMRLRDRTQIPGLVFL